MKKDDFPKGVRKNNLKELALRFRSDLAPPIEQNHRNSSTILRILSPEAEGADKDGLKMGCENSKLFFCKP